jgi:hypothetical protein
MPMIKGDVSNTCNRGQCDLFLIVQSSQFNFNFGVGECSRHFCAVENIVFLPIISHKMYIISVCYCAISLRSYLSFSI